MVEAIRAAVADAGGSPARLLAAVGSVRVVRCLQWNVPDPGALVADALGIDPHEHLCGAIGGNTPQAFMANSAAAIADGRLDAAIVVGAECGSSRARARRAGEWLHWTEQDPDTPSAVPFGLDRAPSTELEAARGLQIPANVYPLIENSLRTAAGWTLSEHLARIGALWSRFSEVAATNPYAWSHTPVSAEEVVVATPKNRMIAFRYPKLCMANSQVDQGAAYIVCSAEVADSAGIARDRWIFPVSGAEANDHWFVSERPELSRSPAIRLAGAAALTLAGVGIDEVSVVDLYSCFPCVVQIAARELGIPLEADVRRLTLTGGLTFGGGPGNNYASHGIASVVEALRRTPGVGMATGLGWFATKHAIGLYSSTPSERGFRSENVQDSVDALDRYTADPDATGPARVETFTVIFDRDGRPDRGIVACVPAPQRRAWANVTDPDQLAALIEREEPEWSGTLRADGTFDLR
jgi:acetyl-CoA C-acetyltransferase